MKKQKNKHSKQERLFLKKQGFKAVRSSWISALAKDDDAVYMRLLNGSIYKYFNGSRYYDRWARAGSKGRFFHKNIKRLDFTRVGTMPMESDSKETDNDLMAMLAAALLVKQLIENQKSNTN